MEHWYDNEISRGILAAKYYHEGETTPQQFIDRVSSIFKGDFRERMKKYITDGDFSPAGRTLYAAGSRGKFKVSMSNCYILPSPEDNLESIFHSNYEIARIFSYGGGIGINISNLRPAGSRVHNVARTSTGAVSFMKIFNTTGEVISQNGRRGAQMVGLNCSHPDIYEFLHIKQNEEKLSSMNISILFTDEFMEAVRDDKEYTLRFHVESTGENIERTIRARDFFREFCETQWDWGDPGALFSDRLNDYHLLAGYDEYQIEITNPCGEFGGNAYNACNLGSINLYNMIDDKFGNAPSLNEEKFKQAVYDGIIALDEIVSYGYETQPLDENRTCIDDWRSLGLGLFGVADALVAMKLAYGSREASAFMENVMKIMLLSALRSSCDRAKMKGTFGRYRREATEKSPIIQKLIHQVCTDYDDNIIYALPNGSHMSFAFARSISLLLESFAGGCASLFKFSFERSIHMMEEVNGSFRVYAHSVKDLLRYRHLPLTLTDDEIREKFPWVIESHDISFMDRVAMQAVMQKYVDNSISSTVNLKNDATPEDIWNIYLAAWESGCKGITVFRDGCRRGNILGVAAKKEEKADGPKPAEGQPVCPECGGKNIRVEGHCAACSDCGWSACSVV